MAIPSGVSDYTAALLRMFPQGDIWPSIEDYNDSNLIKLLASLADELQRVDDDIVSTLLDGVFPSESDFLPGWESVLGLPLTEAAQSEFTRIRTVLAMLSLPPESNEAFFYMLADLVNFAIRISYVSAPDFFLAGDGEAGDELSSGESGFQFVVEITAIPSGESSDTIKSLINYFKPAHTTAIFTGLS